MSVFYERFERHDHGRGLKGQSTHYCPGCGHGLVHKFLAEAIDELGIPVREAVRGACELLGLDPVYVANEGKAVFFVAPEAAEQVLAVLRGHPLGRDAARIGRVTSEHPRMLVARTAMGANRVIPTQIGEQLPRIC